VLTTEKSHFVFIAASMVVIIRVLRRGDWLGDDLADTPWQIFMD